MIRDEYIQTEVMGKCWHEWDYVPIERDYICTKCKAWKEDDGDNPNFSTSRDAYELQQFVLRAELWEEFEEYAWMNRTPEADRGSPHYLKWLFSDASRFADLVAEFRGWKDE
jgi:hypothetical protein